jgi:hypothetical protein
MPNHVIFNIARMMPMDMVALLALAHPISHGVKSRSGELMNIIKAAKVNGIYFGRTLLVQLPKKIYRQFPRLRQKLSWLSWKRAIW